MKRRDRDFVALFNALQYKDFPVVHGHEDLGRRAVWTTHISSIVKQCADLMGLFTCFETGNRTDAVIQKASRSTWAKIEWEWDNPCLKKVNELEKLAVAADEGELMVFIGYSKDTRHKENMDKIISSWKKIETPLLVFLVTYRYEGRRRHFKQLETHYFRAGKHQKYRKQEALPWQVKDTKWETVNNRIGDR